MKRYCFINVLKEDYIKEYKKIHKNPWLEILDVIKSVKVKELVIWSYKNLAIVYYECDDIKRVYKELNKLDITKKWNVAIGPWIKESPALDESGSVVTLEKIFDLNQQIKGKLEK